MIFVGNIADIQAYGINLNAMVMLVDEKQFKNTIQSIVCFNTAPALSFHSISTFHDHSLQPTADSTSFNRVIHFSQTTRHSVEQFKQWLLNHCMRVVINFGSYACLPFCQEYSWRVFITKHRVKVNKGYFSDFQQLMELLLVLRRNVSYAHLFNLGWSYITAQLLYLALFQICINHYIWRY